MKPRWPPVVDSLVVCLLAGSALLLLLQPQVVITNYIQDAWMGLDAGTRFLDGQRLHQDVHTPVGWLYSALFGVAVGLWGYTERVLLLAQVLMTAFTVPLAFAAARDRLGPMERFVFVGVVGFTVLSPRSGETMDLTFLGVYNRWSWSLAAVGLLLLGIPRRTPALARDVGLLTTVLLALFFLKITFFALGGLACAWALFAVPEHRRLAVAAGVLTWGIIGLLAGIGDLPVAYASDLALTAAASTSAHGLDDALDALTQNGTAVAALAVLCVVPILQRSWAPLLRGLGLAALCLAVAWQNHDQFAPALVVPLLILARPTWSLPSPRRLGAPLAVGFGVLLITGPDVLAIGMHALFPRDMLAPVFPGSELWVPKGDRSDDEAFLTGEMTAEDYLDRHPLTAPEVSHAWLTSGVHALDTSDDDRVLGITHFHIFPWTSETRSPTGTLAWHDWNRTFSDQAPLDPEVVLADVTIVMESTLKKDETEEEMFADLEETLERDFVAESHVGWRVWRRRSSTVR